MNTLIFEYPIKNTTGKPFPVPIQEIFNRIRTGSDQVRRAREEYQKGGKSKDYLRMKNVTPSFIPNVSKGGRSKASVEELSGLIYIDLDTNKEENQSLISIDWLEIKEKLKLDDIVFACWLSVSRAGLGVLVRVAGLNQENWLANWSQVSNYFHQLTHREVDKKTKNINRAVFISYDPDIYVNENSRILESLPPGPVIVKSRRVKNSRLSASKGEYEPSTPYFTPTFTLKADQSIFFTQSFIDLHFATDLAKVEFDGINSRYDGKGHYWFRNGFPYARLMGRRKAINPGSRHKELIKTFCTACFLNPHWSEGRLKQWLWQYSADWCPNPLKDSELERIFDFVYYDCLHGNKLVPNISFKKNHFAFESRLHKLEKQSKIGHSKSLETEIKVIDACINSMRSGQYISTKSIMKLVDKSKPTVIKHLRPLNKKAANEYVQRVHDEGKHYEGIIIESLPNFRKIIQPPEPNPEPETKKE